MIQARQSFCWHSCIRMVGFVGLVDLRSNAALTHWADRVLFCWKNTVLQMWIKFQVINIPRAVSHAIHFGPYK